MPTAVLLRDLTETHFVRTADGLNLEQLIFLSHTLVYCDICAVFTAAYYFYFILWHQMCLVFCHFFFFFSTHEVPTHRIFPSIMAANDFLGHQSVIGQFFSILILIDFTHARFRTPELPSDTWLFRSAILYRLIRQYLRALALAATPDPALAAALQGRALEAGKKCAAVSGAAGALCAAVFGLTAPVGLELCVGQSCRNTHLSFAGL